jgi:hypothetical protein
MKTLTLMVCVAALAAGSAVRADHNSKNGDGWANMPNAVHDYRIDIRGDTAEPLQAQGKDDEFTAWVQFGDGAASDNCTLEGGDANCGGVFP